jgi:hypothetical protein
VGDVGTLLQRLAASREPVALGVDFPIGLPRAYAALYATQTDFPAFLRSLERDSAFFEVCHGLDGITPASPFYPVRGVAGMTRLSHALALGLPDAHALSRQCDRATPDRPAGAPLFWTLGANQTGKAAIAAWRDLLLPAFAASLPVALWPFEGAFLSMLRPGRVAIAETYPAEAMRQLGLRMAGSKRRHADRAALAPRLHAIMADLDATPGPAMADAIDAGFGTDAAAEDRFDSTLGLLCVIAVCSGRRTDAAPEDPWIRTWEGWVLGQAAPKTDAQQPSLA